MSPSRKPRYTAIDQNVICPTAANVFMSSGRCQARAIHMLISTINAVPATMEERKKLIGITCDHHCGASMLGISR
jgi:hypothetical protein